MAISHELAAASLLGGIRAYTALHYQIKLLSGESVLICDGASVSV
jgi:NADPH:quinone reductase-like Zn-dependent oxidoreductase